MHGDSLKKYYRASHELGEALKAFYLVVQNLREEMESDLPLNDFERVALENYIALLQITYIEWKRRNLKSPAFKKAA